MLSPYNRSIAKPTGSKVAAKPGYYFLKPVPHKNGIAKILRHATAQNPPKNYGIKTQDQQHKTRHFYSVSFWPVAHAANAWSLSIFCCILFFITLNFTHMYYIKKYADCWAIHNDETGASRMLNETEKLLALKEFPELAEVQVRTIFADKIRSIKEKP